MSQAVAAEGDYVTGMMHQANSRVRASAICTVEVATSMLCMEVQSIPGRCVHLAELDMSQA